MVVVCSIYLFGRLGCLIAAIAYGCLDCGFNVWPFEQWFIACWVAECHGYTTSRICTVGLDLISRKIKGFGFSQYQEW